MKILYFGGGLGNQIFEYAFYLYLKKKFPNEKIIGYYNKNKLKEHNGLEINQWFNIKLPHSSWYAGFICLFMYFAKKINLTKYVDISNRNFNNNKAIVINAYKFNKQYIPNDHKWIEFNIDIANLSLQNRQTLNLIKASNSVFIHVRRGDYLSPKYIKRFQGTCTLDYYNKAIHRIKEHIKSPTFFIFSDDMNWAKRNIITNCKTIYIDWNTKENSPLDMFLMSQCKAGIIANSTFSYWGAQLGISNKFIIYPSKWINSEDGNPDIFNEQWIKI